MFPGAGSFETFRERLRIFRGEPRGGEHFREDDQPFSGFGNGAEQALYARKVLRLGFPGDVHLNEAGFSHIRKYNFFYFGFAYAQTNSLCFCLVSGTRVLLADAAPGCRRRIGTDHPLPYVTVDYKPARKSEDGCAGRMDFTVDSERGTRVQEGRLRQPPSARGFPGLDGHRRDAFSERAQPGQSTVVGGGDVAVKWENLRT